ncbi:MAG: hypothetical protein RBT76_02835 [candidate division Zixibacteria bacterium]|nr:hypothetical protein [candidate division Zixibacteria bacterium]
MKSVKCIVCASIWVLSLASIGSADESRTDSLQLRNQTHCPVMGGKIDSTAYTDIQGQRVYHCCPMCSEKLKADPDSYFRKAAESGIVYENIQTTCPVSGTALEDKSITTYFEGRRLFFCSDTCRDDFLSDPTPRLKKMNESKADAAVDSKKEPSDDRAGHGH